MDLDFIDFQKYLSDAGIEYHTRGKNVTAGWVEIQCPFCGDHSTHLGISPQNLYHCWICGAKGNVLKLVMKLESCSYKNALLRLQQYTDISIVNARYDIIESHQEVGEIILPKKSKRHIHNLIHYLKSRNFTSQEISTIVKKYHIYATDEFGDYKYRIIIPVYIDGELVSFLGRDYTGKNKLSYKNGSVEETILPIKHCVYNIDNIKDRVIITEGVLDCWAMGENAVCLFGIEYTVFQLMLLSTKDIKKAIILFDGDATHNADKLAIDLSSFIPDIKVYELDYGVDPASMDLKLCEEIQEDLYL